MTVSYVFTKLTVKRYSTAAPDQATAVEPQPRSRITTTRSPLSA